ncbi:MAG: hypothetical protein F4Y25_06135 [Chloroflexi bacterium]|nr:hypothetical protein [Chloroflexota bacterium]
MDEPARWVSKDVAARELEVSLSTLDRKIRNGEVEVLREGRRVYVQVDGPEYLSDEELLPRAKDRTGRTGGCGAAVGAHRVGVGAGARRGEA